VVADESGSAGNKQTHRIFRSASIVGTARDPL
jgi:hypothetical protein